MHRVMCRACRVYFDTDSLIEGVDWVHPTQKTYYHKDCYDNWTKRNQIDTTLTENGWYEALISYLTHDIKVKVNYAKLNSQWKKYVKQKDRTAKGIYLAVRYFYEILQGDPEKAQGGIGIVPFVYQDSCAYWSEVFYRNCHILEEIEKQVQLQSLQKVKTIQQTKKKTIKEKVIPLDQIE